MPLFRRSKPATPPDVPKPTTDEKGRSGTVNIRGFLTSRERNAALQWPYNLDVFDEMATTDPTCRWMLQLLINPILAADKEFEPASDSDEDREIAAFCEEVLCEQLDGGLTDFLRRALTYYLRAGHSVFERVAQFTDVQFSYENDKDKEVEVQREAFVVARLADRLPRTIQRWIPDEDKPWKLVEIEQWLADGVGKEMSPRIPAERLVIFTNEKEGDDWRGVSILRSAYFPYKMKLKLENIEAIALERSAGLPLCYPPANATDTQKDEMARALDSMRQGESLWLMAPGPKWSPQEPNGWLIEDLAIQGDAERSPHEAIERYKGDMARNILAEFMRLGHEQVGARATADVQQDPYYQAELAIAHYVESIVNQAVIKPLVAWNYDTRRFPKLKLGNIQAKNIQILGTVLANLARAKVISPDFKLENYLRRLVDAPELNPEDEEEIDRGTAPKPDPVLVPPVGDDGKPMPPGPKQPKPPDPAKQAALSDRAYRRPLRTEEFYIALTEVERTLDDANDDLVQAAEEAAREPLDALRKQVEQAVRVKAPQLITKLELAPGPIAAAVERVLVATYAAGRQQIRAELRRQGAGARFQDGSDEPTPTELLVAKAAAIAAAIAAAGTRALRAWGLRYVESGIADETTVGLEPLGAVRDEARKAAAGYVNGAWAQGRHDEMIERRAEISEAIYSAILDDHTCSPCSEADGRIGPPGGDAALPCPNPNCHGGGRCRCMWIAIAREEAVRLPVAASEAVKLAVEPFGERLAAMERQIERVAAAAQVRPQPSDQAKIETHIHIDEGAIQANQAPIEVHLPEQEPPTVNVNPPKGRRTVRFTHDDDGRPTGAEIEED